MEDPIPIKFQYGASFYIALITLMGTILNVKAVFILLETTKVTIIDKLAFLNNISKSFSTLDCSNQMSNLKF